MSRKEMVNEMEFRYDDLDLDKDGLVFHREQSFSVKFNLPSLQFMEIRR